MRRVKNTNLLFCVVVNLYRSHNRAAASRKCFIKAPAKYETSIHIFNRDLHSINSLNTLALFDIGTIGMPFPQL